MSDNRIAELEHCLRQVVYEHAAPRCGWLYGFSTVADAMNLLGIPNPCQMPEEICCDEPGCTEKRSCGWPSKDGYRFTCHAHCKD